MLYSSDTKKKRRKAYNIITAFNRNLTKVKSKPRAKTMLNGKPKLETSSN